MASAELRKELECSICLNTYTNPITLLCGHSFCWECMDGVLDTQKTSGGYSCPECREKIQGKPKLKRNTTLHNIVQYFLYAESDKEDSQFSDTQVLHTREPAVTSCQVCEVSLCGNHLRVYSKAPEHDLCGPTTSLENRKCSVHEKVQEFFCTEDIISVCVSSLNDECSENKTESLKKASEKKKMKLLNDLQKLMMKTEVAEKSLRSLQECRTDSHNSDTERVFGQIRDLREWLLFQEKRVHVEISRQAKSMSGLCDDVKRLLSSKMHDIEELCNTTAPLTVLQKPEGGDLCDTEEGDNKDRQRDEQHHDREHLYMTYNSHASPDPIDEANGQTGIGEAAEILLDVNTAENYLHVSHDRRVASWTHIDQNGPDTPERFQEAPQVLSVQSFSSGRHYWEVDVGESECWRVGMCYPSIDRRGGQSCVGYNKKSWCLYKNGNQYSALHDGQKIHLLNNISSHKIRIYLDYEGGRISFYALCDPVRHLHTFTAAFTEPLHAAICVGYLGCVKIVGEHLEMWQSYQDL
ncbi:E3 ubiquitin/ISG15 ligase TRIM25-like [Hyperolius riggenbachi]|uniref:E3 ubiquitin/ISG15 ligase TRIM25-like n=1 Tax=Hyperolius riggenbachi TaxID=752182 RepID=UPI0035A2F8AF